VTAPLGEDRLAEITALEAAATKGPWHTATEAGAVSYPSTFVANWSGEYMQGVGDVDTGVGEQAEADLSFILDARTAVPELLAEVARLRAAVPAACASGYRAAADQAAEAVAVHGADADAVLLCLRQGAAMREAIAGTGGVQ
jgi:hypothetical protein